jgi:hypothetical protein
MNADGWTSGPDTTAESDLSRARYLIAGLVAEVLTKKDKPGSSLDERGLVNMLVNNATIKLLGETPFETLAEADAHGCSAERLAYFTKLGDEQVWDAAVAILRNNWDLFQQLAQELYRRHRIKGSALQKILSKVKRIAS